MEVLFKIEYIVEEKDYLRMMDFIRWCAHIYPFINSKHMLKGIIKRIWINKANRKIFVRSLCVLIFLVIISACLLCMIWDSLWDHWILAVVISIVYISAIIWGIIIRNIGKEKKGQKIHIAFYESFYVVQSEKREEKYSICACLETEKTFVLPGIWVISKERIGKDVEKEISALIRKVKVK